MKMKKNLRGNSPRMLCTPLARHEVRQDSFYIFFALFAPSRFTQVGGRR